MKQLTYVSDKNKSEQLTNNNIKTKMVFDLTLNWIKQHIFNKYQAPHITDEIKLSKRKKLNSHNYSIDTTVIIILLIIIFGYYTYRYFKRSRLNKISFEDLENKSNKNIELKRLYELENGTGNE